MQDAATAAGASHPAPERVPLVSWKAFATAVDRLRQQGVPRTVTGTALGVRDATAKQLVSTFRTLGLVSNGNEPSLALRRLLKGDDAALIEVLATRYPSLVRPLETGELPDLGTLKDDFGLSDEAARRFRAFLNGAVGKGRRREAHPTQSGTPRDAPGSPGRRAVTTRGPAGAATKLAEAEGEVYLEALREALARGDTRTATWLHERLAAVRQALVGMASTTTTT